MTPETILAPAEEYQTDPLTEAYLEQPSDWWAVPIVAVFAFVGTMIWAVS